MQLLFKVRAADAIPIECVGDDAAGLKKNDWCIVAYPRYEDCGRVVSMGPVPAAIPAETLPAVRRQATLVDQAKAHENNVRSKSFHRIAQEKVKEHKLPMRLVSTHIVFDRSLAIFVFTAPGRVDFRGLLRDLTRAIACRVELRQIGPRDQAGLVGGLGACGRVLCCSSFLTNFVSINVKMAKAQGLSLNPSNIIGACGRLKCCLSYEYESYQELVRGLPRSGARCRCEGCDGHVVEGNPLTQTLRVCLDDNRLVTVPVAEVELLSE